MITKLSFVLSEGPLHQSYIYVWGKLTYTCLKRIYIYIYDFVSQLHLDFYVHN